MIPHDFKNYRRYDDKANRMDYIGMVVLAIAFAGLTYWILVLASNP